MIQVVEIHGGSTHDSYEKYLEELRSKQVTKKHLFPWIGWKQGMRDELGPEYEVLMPQMPNKQNSKYAEWKIWFDKIVPLLDEKIILVGHSLGGIFLAKYLSENVIDKDILATFLVAAPFDDSSEESSLADFVLPESLAKFTEQSRIIHLYQSTDDPVVPFTELAKYQAKLPYALASVFEDRGHFNQDDFPELTSDIKAIN
ncbi:MAG: hypothetical protein AB199_03045 [Parcubacteria bacterium C7867-004]|nr:MAG: hypothetical protein AB199_03045 [Parcubacteria bacterium C7867-004]